MTDPNRTNEPPTSGPPPLPLAPDGRPYITDRRKWILFFIGLLGGSAFSFFIFFMMNKGGTAADLLTTLLVLVGLKIGMGTFFVIRWRTRSLGIGLLLSIPLTILLLFVGCAGLIIASSAQATRM